MSLKPYKCECCYKEFDEEEYQMTLDKNKCILHCEKNIWINENNNWNIDKCNYFWSEIKKIINSNNETRLMLNSNPLMDNEHNNMLKKRNDKLEFKEIIFPKFIRDQFTSLEFDELENCNVYFYNCKFLALIDFSNLSNMKNILFEDCKFYEDTKFIKLNIDSEFILTHSTFYKACIINSSIFNNLVDFTRTKFNQLSLDFTKFKDITIFRKCEIEDTLCLVNTNFYDRVDFLDITLKMANRETARIIKDSFEQQNNIIEANKFYALEMKEREKELSWKNDFFEKLIFSFHGLSSNHSQNWLLPIFWIVFFGLLNSYFQPLNFYTMNYVDVLYKEFFVGLLASLTTFVFLLSLIQHKIYYNYVSSFFIILFVYLVFTNDIYFSDFANSVNPFSIMTKGEELTFGILIYKIILAYLIYQLIISIRQNTRRK